MRTWHSKAALALVSACLLHLIAPARGQQSYTVNVHDSFELAGALRNASQANKSRNTSVTIYLSLDYGPVCCSAS